MLVYTFLLDTKGSQGIRQKVEFMGWADDEELFDYIEKLDEALKKGPQTL